MRGNSNITNALLVLSRWIDRLIVAFTIMAVIVLGSFVLSAVAFYRTLH